MSPSWGGVLGGALTAASNAYLDTVLNEPYEKIRRRKAELELERLESQIAYDRARSAYEARRGAQPDTLKTSWGLYRKNPETGQYELFAEKPPAPDTPQKLMMQKQWELTQQVLAGDRSPETLFNLDILSKKSGVVITPDGRVVLRSDVLEQPAGTPAPQPGGTRATPPTTPPTTPEAPSGQPPTGVPSGPEARPSGVPGTERLSQGFRARAQQVAERVGTNLDDLLRVMHFETAGTFDPAQRNIAGSGATGLIQFMPETARRLGTTTDVLARMSPETQLDYVEKYLAPYKGRLGNLQDLYMAVFWPEAIGKDPNTVLFTQKSHPLAYRQNAALDRDKDGAITAGDAVAAVQRTTGLPVAEAPPSASGRRVEGGQPPAASPNNYYEAWKGRALEDIEREVQAAVQADPQRRSVITQQKVEALERLKAHRASLGPPGAPAPAPPPGTPPPSQAPPSTTGPRVIPPRAVIGPTPEKAAADRRAEEATARAQQQLDLAQKRYDLELTRWQEAEKRQDAAGKARIEQAILRETRDQRGRLAGVDESLSLIRDLRRFITPGTVGALGWSRAVWQTLLGQLRSPADHLAPGSAGLMQKRALALASTQLTEATSWQAEENALARQEGRAPVTLYIPPAYYDPRMRLIDFLKEVLAYSHARAINGRGVLTDRDVKQAKQSLGLDSIWNSADDAQVTLGGLENFLKHQRRRAEAQMKDIESRLRTHLPAGSPALAPELFQTEETQ